MVATRHRRAQPCVCDPPWPCECVLLWRTRQPKQSRTPPQASLPRQAAPPPSPPSTSAHPSRQRPPAACPAFMCAGSPSTAK